MRDEFVSLTTDYGRSDGFVASVHGAILRLRPSARVIDVTHDIDPGDVVRGAAVLAQTVPYLPEGVHVAIVDPGVGTSRRGIALRTANGFLVGPDNGLLIAAAIALGGIDAVVELTNSDWHAPEVTPTFHGRDIFGPVAAHLLSGRSFDDAGQRLDPASLTTLPPPYVHISHGHVEAQVVTIDRFGNVQLALPASALEELSSELDVAGMSATRAATFGDAPPGGLIVFGDSAGHTAIAINGGRAVIALGVAPGDIVLIRDRDHDA
jgi:S-adenosylmethionine hydrolase